LNAYTLAAVPLVIWIYLWLARGRFWRVGPFVDRRPLTPAPPRRVVIVIPARNEAEAIGATVSSLAKQSFGGFVHLIVVDDASTDGTAELAASAAARSGFSAHLSVVQAAALPEGWTGKLWALSQGVVAAAPFAPDYLLLTDADISHAPDSIDILVRRAELDERDLVSHMVRLSTATRVERLLIPAFVFFFFKLYPPSWIADPSRRTAGAAGGCVLIRPPMLERIGGIQAIRSRIIDDCALARAVKQAGGRIWLGLAPQTRSLRVYRTAAEVGAMISRTAFSQLGHSYLLLLATLVGLLCTYVAPVALLFTGDPTAMGLGALALLLMSLCYLPMVRFYGLPAYWCLCLPLIALFYLGSVLHSALQYARGRGGYWKGRLQDAPTAGYPHPARLVLENRELVVPEPIEVRDQGR
jgi:hopene-associated glycosyltransferase HpnB